MSVVDVGKPIREELEPTLGLKNCLPIDILYLFRRVGQKQSLVVSERFTFNIAPSRIRQLVEGCKCSLLFGLHSRKLTVNKILESSARLPFGIACK